MHSCATLNGCPFLLNFNFMFFSLPQIPTSGEKGFYLLCTWLTIKYPAHFILGLISLRHWPLPLFGPYKKGCVALEM